MTAPTPTGIAVLTILAGILIAMISGYVELRKTRVQREVTPPDTQRIIEKLDKIEKGVSRLNNKIDDTREKIIRLDNPGYNRRSTDR